MFKSGSGYFCCEPGLLGVLPSVGKSGGLCEPPDHVIPKTLLATIVSQVGVAAATPAPSGTTITNNATTTGQTNPIASTTSISSSGSTTTSKSHATNINSWPLATKIGVGAAVIVLVVSICVISSICRSRRRRNRGVIPGSYQYGNELGEFDEYDNRTGVYGAGRSHRPGYEPYRVASPAPPTQPNHVTVNVVQGDLAQ